MATNNKTAETTAPVPEELPKERNFSKRRWTTPHFRAERFAKERKERVHTVGPKKGLELDDYNKGLRSGYLLCQSDHAGRYRYDQAREAGKSKKEALEYSFQRGTKKPKEEK